MIDTIISIIELFLISQAQPTFHGKVWRDIYNNPADSANVILTHPNGIDTVMAKVGGVGPAYWTRAPPDWWNLQLEDVVGIKVIDANGEDSTKTWRDVTSLTSDLVTDLFVDPDEPNGDGQSLLIKKVWDTVDSVNAKCWVKDKQDTLDGRFRINTNFYNISFNAKNFPLASRPQIGDSVFFKMTEGTYEAISKGTYQEFFIDADTFPSCSLKIVGVKENLEKKVYELELIIKPNPVTNYIVFGKKFDGFLYDISGKRISSIDVDKGYRLNLGGIPSGIYYLVGKKTELDKPKKIIKIK